MKAVLISIRPKLCELIAREKKTVEVRKTRPKIETPFKCYIYETKGLCDTPTFIDEDGHISYRGRGAVIGEFMCDRVNHLNGYWLNGEDALKETTCLDDDEIMNYIEYIDRTFHLWRISELKIYDKPKELGEFDKPCNKNANCAYCKQAEFNGGKCNGRIIHPPQSWCYVEKID